MCKIIFLDVDGTLINADGIIPTSTKYAIKKAKENGHQFAGTIINAIKKKMEIILQ